MDQSEKQRVLQEIKEILQKKRFTASDRRLLEVLLDQVAPQLDLNMGDR